MDYTLYDLMKGPLIEKWEPVTKGIDYKKRVITAISVQELPLAPYIRPGELVLSTALGAVRDPKILSRIVAEAGSAGASAILFGFQDPEGNALNEPGSRLEPVFTTELIRQAESFSLPLIILRCDVRFAKIQAEVNAGILTARMDPYIQLQNSLFNAYFEGKTLSDAAEAIADTLSTEVAIRGWAGQPLAATPDFREAAATFEIGINREHLGYLDLASESSVSEETGTLIRQYISYPLALWIEQLWVALHTEARLRSDFVLRLIRRGPNEALIQEAGQLGIPLHKVYRALVLVPSKESPDGHRIILQNAAEIVREAYAIGRDLNLAVLAGSETGRFILFLEWPSTGGEILLPRFLDRLQKRIRELIPGTVCHTGISPTFSGGRGFDAAYEEAAVAQGYCDQPGDQMVYYEDARKIRIISAVSVQTALRQDAQKILTGLLEYDSLGGSMELMNTLTTYIKTNYNISETARVLCIHRQSLLARLRKIEELTGLSLKDHDDLFVLEVYSRLYRNY